MLLLFAFILALVVWYSGWKLLSMFRNRSVSSGTRGATPGRSRKGMDRDWGEWTPTRFLVPKISPCSLDLSDIKPIPYRPFRWGEYHVTMGIRSMPWDDWIELDNEFPLYHRIKLHRIRTRGEDALRVLPDRPGVVDSGRLGAVELVHELAEYLSIRYPSTFSMTRIGEVRSISINPLYQEYELPPPLHVREEGGKMQIDPVSQQDAERAMEISALLVQDDLALMVEGFDGRYYFQAGAICVPGFWRMRDKIGLPLEEIHVTGNVPQYREKLHTSLERFFRRLTVDKPVIRNNYFIQVVQPTDSPRRSRLAEGNHDAQSDNDVSQLEVDDLIDPEELAWSSTTNGPEDTFTHGHPAHPTDQPAVTPQTLRMRTERQTLRRLPLSGAIVFTIRTYVVPIEELGKEPGVPARMASAVRSWPEGVGRYKGKSLYEKVLLEYLDRCAEDQNRDQVAMNLNEKTRSPSFPL